MGTRPRLSLAETCANADGGHLEVLQWARSQECPWNEWTCQYAARGGHLEVLQWGQSGHSLEYSDMYLECRGREARLSLEPVDMCPSCIQKSQDCPWSDDQLCFY